jgi:hypothetical protein
MRWLLDQGLPRSAAALLNNTSQDPIHVGIVLNTSLNENEPVMRSEM